MPPAIAHPQLASQQSAQPAAGQPLPSSQSQAQPGLQPVAWRPGLQPQSAPVPHAPVPHVPMLHAVPGSPGMLSQARLPAPAPVPAHVQAHLVVHRLTVRLATMALKQIRAMSMREMTCVMSSLVKLRAPLKKSYYVGFMHRARRTFPQHVTSTTAQGLAELLWAVARCGMRGLRPDWGAAYCAALEARWEQVDARIATRVLHALAWLHYVPSDAWLDALLSKVQTGLGSTGAASSQDVSITTWALARLRYSVPPPLMSDLTSAAGSRMAACTAQELPILLWGLARMVAPTPAAAWQVAACERALQLLPQLSGQGLSLVVYAAGLLGMSPPPGWLHTVLQHARSTQFRYLTPQGMALLVYGASQMRQPLPDGWLHAFHAHIEAMTQEFQPAAVELIQSAFQTLRNDSNSRSRRPLPASSGSTAAAGSNGHGSVNSHAVPAAGLSHGAQPRPGSSAQGAAGSSSHVNGASVGELLFRVEDGIEWELGLGTGSIPGGSAGAAASRQQRPKELQTAVVRPVRFAR